MFSSTPSFGSSTSSFGPGLGFGQYSNRNVSSNSGIAGFGQSGFGESTNTNISATGAFGSQVEFGHCRNTNAFSTNPSGYQNAFGKTSNPFYSTSTISSPVLCGSSSASLSSSSSTFGSQFGFQQSRNTNVSSTNPLGSQNVFRHAGPGIFGPAPASTGGATFAFGTPIFGPAPASLVTTSVQATSSSPYIWASSSGPTTSFQAPAVNASTSAGFSFGCTATSVQSTVPFGDQGKTPISQGLGTEKVKCSFNVGSRVTSYNETAEMGLNAQGNLLSISAMPVYKDKCHEELRWEDYQLGDKGTQAKISIFDSISSGRSAFSSQYEGSTVAPYCRTWDCDRSNNGTLFPLESISAMSVYKDKSHEELRWEDYQLNNRGCGVDPASVQYPVDRNNNPFLKTVTYSVPSNPFSPRLPSFSFPTSSVPSNQFLNTLPSSTPSNPFWNAVPSSFPSNPFLNTLPSSAPSNPFWNAVPSSFPSNPFNMPPITYSSALSTAQSSSFFSPPTPAAPPFTSSNSNSLFGPNQSSCFNVPPITSSSALSTAQSSSFFSPPTPPTPSFPSNSNSLFGPNQSSCFNVPPITSTSGLNTPQSSSFSSPSTPPTPLFPSNSNSFFGPNQSSCFISPPIPPAAPFSLNLSAGATSIFQPIPFNYASFAPFPYIYGTSVTVPATASIPCQFVPMLSMIPPSTSSYMPPVTQTEVMKPSPITSSFETPHVAPPDMLAEGPRTTSPPSQRYGIPSTPVSERPSPVRNSFVLTITNHGGDGPKVEFSADAHNTPSTARIELPNHNPRAFIDGSSEEWNLRANFNNISLDKHTSIHLYENGKVSVEVSTPVLDGSLCQDKDGDSGKTSAATQSLEHKFSNGDHPTKKEDNIDKLMPKLKNSDYYMEPRVEDLAIKESSDPGFCSRVKDFVVGRHGYGSVKFLGETDVRQLDLESYIEFRDREVIVYKDESKKLPVGEGLNKPAEITLSNIKCVDKKSGKQYIDGPELDKYREMLMKKAAELGAEFTSYDPVKGEWKFRVAHF